VSVQGLGQETALVLALVKALAWALVSVQVKGLVKALALSLRHRNHGESEQRPEEDRERRSCALRKSTYSMQWLCVKSTRVLV